MTRREGILASKVKLGATLPWLLPGRPAIVSDTDATLRAEILRLLRARGLFAESPRRLHHPSDNADTAVCYAGRFLRGHCSVRKSCCAPSGEQLIATPGC